MDHSVKDGMAETGMAETGTANTNTHSGPKHKRCMGHIHSHLEQRAAWTVPIFSATGREVSVQRYWLQLHAVHDIVIVAPKLGSGRSMPGKAGAGAKLGDAQLG